MSKNEAVNTFNGGLVMDLNPVSTPNNVLTNCLNGTLVTYNGNEYTLQSDMGNGRVETAYLPSGYVPIGIKEHGGIIYVASHNPITGKSQIGSFPSPERNISSEELNDSDARIDFSKFADNLVQRIKLFGEEAIIRSGDKFSIIMIPNISGTSSDLKKLLSNYQNILNGKVKCLKNKLITLDVAVLDSNNNLHSITNTLKRFDQSTNLEIKDSYKLAQDVKVNTEYFTQTFNTKLDVSSPDSIDKFRNIKARNTFNSKLIGNLCIIATLNTVSQFEFSIGGTIEGENTRLYLDSAFEYNCPDGRYNGSSTYGSASDFDPDNSIVGYDITFENERVLERKNFQTSNINFDSDVYDETHSCTKYNKENNLYISKQLDTYVIQKKSGIVYYTATPISIVGPLNGLSISGQIDLDKVGSGEMNVTHWRYYKNEDYVSLQWGLEYYPKYKEAITDMRFSFYDIYSSNFNTPTYIYSIDKKRNYNGVFTELLHLPEWDGIKNKLFLVKIEYKLNTQNEFQVLDYRWLFNTRLYNEAYAKGEILDFGVDNQFLKDLRKVSLEINTTKNMTRTNKQVKDPLVVQNTSSLVVYNRETSQTYQFNPKSQINFNADLYPFINTITFEENYSIDNQKIIDSSTVSDLSSSGSEITSLVNLENYKDYIKINNTYNINRTVTVSSKSALQYTPKDKPVSIKTLFTPIFQKEVYIDLQDGKVKDMACFFASVEDKPDAGHRNHAYIRFNKSCPRSQDPKASFDGAIELNSGSGKKSGRQVFGIGQPSGLNYDEVINQVKSSNKVITVLGTHPNGGWSNWKSGRNNWVATSQIQLTENIDVNSDTNYQTLWWNDISGTPTLLGHFVTGGTQVVDKLEELLGKYYKRNSLYSNSQAVRKGLVEPNYGYNNNYNLIFSIIILCKIFNINLNLTEYQNSLENCLTSLVTNLETINILKESATFITDQEKNIELSQEEILQIEGLQDLFNILKSPEEDFGFGYIQDNNLQILDIVPNNISANRTYYVDKNAGTYSLASSNFERFFVEKEGLFYIKTTNDYTTRNTVLFRCEADSFVCVLVMNSIRALNLSYLGLDLQQWKQW